MANYDPRRDRHKPTTDDAGTPLDALLGPDSPESAKDSLAPSRAASQRSSPPLDASALDDRWPLARPHVTPGPSALPQQIPLVVWIAASIGAVASLVGSIWAWSKLRPLLRRLRQG